PVRAGIPHDECGWLAEARSEPSSELLRAVHNLEFADKSVSRAVAQWNEFAVATDLVFLMMEPTLPIPRDTLLLARRRFAKGVEKFQNLYGFKCHRNKRSEGTAGIHVSVTRPSNVRWTDEKGRDQERLYYSLFDFVPFVRAMDKEFKAEIEAARRRPGFYEVKGDGRIEYRSLPNNISYSRLEEGISRVLTVM
ncbi:MAG: hypothetical protein MN733_01430, partial [Nitrososphaera sp.]|nr:hypothetical protein [Nitrososphaera sp.]